MLNKLLIIILSVVCSILYIKSDAQVSVWQETHRGSVYFGLGYNTYTDPSSTIHIYQGDLSNSYDLLNVKSQKSNSSSTSGLMNSLTYNIGYFFNYNQTWALEFCYSPLSYSIVDNQKIQIKGIKNGNNIDTNFIFSEVNGNHYNLSNSTCLFQLNLVRRYPLYRNKVRNISFDIYGKVGVGTIMLKPDNQLDSNSNKPKLSTSASWNVDFAAGLRTTLNRHVFIECLAKYNIYYLNNIDIYKGVANQDFSYLSINFNIGYVFSVTKHNPMFRKGEKGRKKGVPTGPEPRGDLKPQKAENNLIENY